MNLKAIEDLHTYIYLLQTSGVTCTLHLYPVSSYPGLPLACPPLGKSLSHVRRTLSSSKDWLIRKVKSGKERTLGGRGMWLSILTVTILDKIDGKFEPFPPPPPPPPPPPFQMKDGKMARLAFARLHPWFDLIWFGVWCSILFCPRL